MRFVVGIALWLVATASGLIAAAWFTLAGLGWSNGFFTRRYWEEGEGDIGVGLSVFGLVVWLALLWWSFAVIRGGSAPPSTAARVTSGVLVWVSVAAVLIACVASLVLKRTVTR